MNELECIRAFVKVVEAGSFTEAARQTGTVKSVITKRVNQLEEHLELQLLQRSTRRISITDGGADFYERSVHLLAELENAKAAVSSTEWGLTGNFRVSCVSAFTAAYLADDLCEFQKAHPALNVELRLHDRFCDPVQEGFDVSVQPDSVTRGVLEKADIVSLRRMIVATPDYIKKFGMPKQPAELKSLPFAHNNHISPECTIHLVNSEGRFDVQLEPDILTNNVWMLRSAVMQNEHLAMMPTFFIEKELVSGQLVPVLPEYEIRGAKLCAFYRRSSFVPMKVRLFINFLLQKYGQFPLWEQRIHEARPELSMTLDLTKD